MAFAIDFHKCVKTKCVDVGCVWSHLVPCVCVHALRGESVTQVIDSVYVVSLEVASLVHFFVVVKSVLDDGEILNGQGKFYRFVMLHELLMEDYQLSTTQWFHKHFDNRPTDNYLEAQLMDLAQLLRRH